MACAGLYLAFGAGFVLDDWFYLRNARTDGVFGTVNAGGDRPVGAAIFTVVFGMIGHRVAVVYLVVATINALSGALFTRAVRHVAPTRLAWIAGLAWALIPTHTALEAWLSTVQASTAQLMASAVVVSLTSSRPRRVERWLVPLLAASCLLAYESAAFACAVAVVLIPRWSRGRFDLRLVGTTAAAQLVALGWALTHQNPARQPQGKVADLAQVIPANFGWGLTGSELVAAVITASALVAMGIALYAVLGPRRIREPGAVAIAVGAVVLVLGVVPFSLYFYAPLGAGDRANHLSAFGAALVWAGAFEILARRHVALLAGAGVALVAVALPTRVERTDLWATAGRDAERISVTVAGQVEPGDVVLFGPEPIVVDNIAAFLDGSNVRGAVQFARGSRDVTVQLAQDASQFAAVAADLRVDLRTLSELDDIADPGP